MFWLIWFLITSTHPIRLPYQVYKELMMLHKKKISEYKETLIEIKSRNVRKNAHNLSILAYDTLQSCSKIFKWYLWPKYLACVSSHPSLLPTVFKIGLCCWTLIIYAPKSVCVSCWAHRCTVYLALGLSSKNLVYRLTWKTWNLHSTGVFIEVHNTNRISEYPDIFLAVPEASNAD